MPSASSHSAHTISTITIITLSSDGPNIPEGTGSDNGDQPTSKGGLLPWPLVHPTTNFSRCPESITHSTAAPEHTRSSEVGKPITFSGFTISLPWKTITLEPTTWSPALPSIPATFVPVPSDPTTFVTIKTTATSKNQSAPVQKSTRSLANTSPHLTTATITFPGATVTHNGTTRIWKPTTYGTFTYTVDADETNTRFFPPKPAVPTHDTKSVRAEDRIAAAEKKSTSTTSSATTWATSSPFKLQCDSGICNTYCSCTTDGHVDCSYDPGHCRDTCYCRGD
ncbi:hypothetical protein PG993_012155 [Apiospora rasikravindrae]|uniref:Uncharacterized protein n=1 Tax=Apiospora rasikravindrae TaxID=990691 RepID=A0ABR1S1Q1_9PEZI